MMPNIQDKVIILLTLYTPTYKNNGPLKTLITHSHVTLTNQEVIHELCHDFHDFMHK